MTFTAVVTCHAASPAKIITNLLTQTRRPDEILVFVSDPTPEALGEIRRLEDVSPIETFLVPNRDDWGHEKRASGLDRATCKFVGWFNHDDEYDPTYVEMMMISVELGSGADVAFCNWTHQRQSAGSAEFRSGSSTSGNWIVRTSVARAAGYRSRQYSADGLLIGDVAAQKPRVVKVDARLYHHNP